MPVAPPPNLPPFMTETDEAAWVDCVVCSYLMGRAYGKPGSMPGPWAARRALRNAIRVAANDTASGFSLPQCDTGAAKVDGVVMPHQLVTRTGLEVLLRQGFGGAVVGKASGWGLPGRYGKHWQRWSPSFREGHSVAVFGYALVPLGELPADARVGLLQRTGLVPCTWLMDPLGRTVGGKPWRGEWCPLEVLDAFMKPLRLTGGPYYVALTLPSGITLEVPTMELWRPERWAVAQGKPFFASARAAEPAGTFSGPTGITTLGPAVVGKAIDEQWLKALITTAAVVGGSVPKLVYVRRTDLQPPTTVPPSAWAATLHTLARDPAAALPGTPPPPPPADCTDEVEAALAPWRAYAGQQAAAVSLAVDAQEAQAGAVSALTLADSATPPAP